MKHSNFPHRKDARRAEARVARKVKADCPVKWTGLPPQHPSQPCPNCGKYAKDHQGRPIGTKLA